MFFRGVLNVIKLDVGGQSVVLNCKCCGDWLKIRQWEICCVRIKPWLDFFWNIVYFLHHQTFSYLPPSPTFLCLGRSFYLYLYSGMDPVSRKIRGYSIVVCFCIWFGTLPQTVAAALCDVCTFCCVSVV